MEFYNENISFSNIDLKRNLKLPSKLTPELAELIGIILGDGCIYLRENIIRQSKYELIIYGHSIEDLEFHKNNIRHLFDKLFNITTKIIKIPEKNAIKIRISSKAMTYFFVKNVGLIPGNKTKKNSGIPDYFLSLEDIDIICSLIRGLADTDFCLKFKTRKNKRKIKNYYPLIVGKFGTDKMPKQVNIFLNKVGITSHLEYNKRKINETSVVITGKKNLKKWMDSIGFNNSKHLIKYDIWKKYGFCPPNIELETKQKILKGEINPYLIAGL